MTTITHTESGDLSSSALFFPLISGKLRPDNLWHSGRFRTKFALRTALYPFTTLTYLQQLAQLPFLPQLMASQGLLPAKPHRPYLCSRFSVAQRARAIVQHYQHVAQLDNPALRQLMLNPAGTPVAQLSGKNEEQFTIACSSGYYDREGELTLTLHYQDMLLASLSFSLIGGPQRCTLFIGGLQGPRKHIPSEAIREATKAAHGLFPKRVLMEALFLLAEACGAEAIAAVGDTTHVFRSLRYRHSKGDKFFASYSEFWLSLGGEERADGCFTLPLQMERKALEEIASKKRAEYRRRYTLLDSLKEQVQQAAGCAHRADRAA
ncbi:DUF535 domain-containing protein [Pantoea sp. ICBG 1758]|jgi:uncharacterized protein VirK/YbjX|uniref:VirK/YbjX family protein n=1 Tax=unclassified Pantoea TaxID=2630326 RepID=UPI0008FD115A|nr:MULTISPECIES: VirK/YbjX family protein [unclassified Pantoea]OIX98490.1 hypothetical protein BFS13_14120 [Pantoea sp. Ae16]PPC61792.1 DUF535 domain-containing protein [Pantoea sp. ICBG 1758]